MPDESDPPRKFYTFKPREFERVNAAPSPSDAPPPAPDPGVVAANTGKVDVRELARMGAGAGDQLGSNTVTNRDNDVHAILRENFTNEKALGLHKLKPHTPRQSRRQRDYWVLLIGMNTFIAVLYAIELFVGFQVQCLAAQMPQEFGNLVRYALHNPVAYAMAFLGMFTLSATLTWLMFGLMDDY